MGQTVGQINLGLNINQKAFNRQLQGIADGAEKSVMSAFKPLGKMIGGALGIAAITKFTKSCLDLGSNLSEVQNVVDTTFKTMNQSVNDFAGTAMSQFGLSETVTKQYMGTLGAMSKSMGFTEQASYSMSKAVTGLAGDVASFYNLSTDEAFNKLKSIWTGETETLKSIGVLLTQTNLDQYALNNGFGKTTASMTEQEKVMLRYRYTMSALSDASGDFAKTSGSWANQTRILTLQFDALKATIGQGFINLFTPILQMINALLAKLQVLAQSFKSFTELIAGDSGSAAASGMAAVASNAENAAQQIGGVESSAKKALKALLGVDEINKLQSADSGVGAASAAGIPAVDVPVVNAEGTKAAVSSLMKEILEPLKNISFENLKISFENLKNSVKPLVEDAGTALKWLYDNMLVPLATWTIEDALPAGMNLLAGAMELLGAVAENIVPKLAAIWDNFLKPVAGFTAETIVGILNGVGNALSYIASNEAAVDLIGDLVIGFGGIMLYSKVASVIVSASMSIKGFLTAMKALTSGNLVNGTTLLRKLANVFALVAGGAGTLQEAMKAVFGGITTVVSGVAAVISGAVLAVKNFFRMWSDGWNVLESILMAIGIAIAAVGAVILGAPAAVAAIVAAIVAVVANLVILIKEHFHEICDFIKAVVDSIGTFLRDTWSAICTVVSGIVEGLCDGVSLAFTSLKDMISSVLESIKDAVTNIFTGIWNFIKGTINTILGGIESLVNGVINGVNSMINALNNLKLNVPDWVPEIGGKTIGFNLGKLSNVSIPKLAEGGYVGANQPQLAMIGDNKHHGEIVAPEDKMLEVMMQALEQFFQRLEAGKEKVPEGGDIIIPVYIGNEKIDEIIITAQQRRNMRSGGR